MRTLLISSAYNSMAQRVHVQLADRGHLVSVELALGVEVMREAVRRSDPDLVMAIPRPRRLTGVFSIITLVTWLVLDAVPRRVPSMPASCGLGSPWRS